MITIVSSAAALNAALKVAHTGDTIELAAGTYSGITAANLHFATGVTVTSADPTHEATITGLHVSASSGLTFQGLDFYADPAGGQNPFQVTSGSDSIVFDHLSVHGQIGGDLANQVGAFLLRDSTNLSVTNSGFQYLWIGIGHLNASGLTVSGNNLHDIRMDGVRGGGSNNVTVSNNTFTDFHPLTGEHADAIQFWTTNTTAPTHDIAVTNNLMQRGTGAVIQGVFLGDEASQGYQHVHISGNGVIGEMYNGIAVMGGSDVTIDHNLVVGFSDMESGIRIEHVNGGSITSNSANDYITTATDVSVTMTSDLTVGLAGDGGAAALSQWEQAHGASGAVITGTAGADTLTGTAGDDTINGVSGADLLTGGDGNDLYITDGHATIVETATGGIDTVQSTGSFTLPNNVENLVFVGTYGAWGSGNKLNNVITGNAGANNLFGRDGDDTISGGGGSDTLTGGNGADHFVFARGDGHDIVTDFGLNGEHDVLDISSFLNAGLTPTLTETAAGVTVSFTTGDSILLQGQHIANLHTYVLGYIF
jgi:Ca2+-binding RTX toxin-like protein